jgi:hypothetical protein
MGTMMEPFPLEKEFQVRCLKDNLHALSREELEDLLGQSLEVIAKLTHQTKQLVKIIDEKRGKLT